jgi:2-polyprenyl-3-methyl-5-hydroxy-6-metoxy-1,4-benzoquinol methylase/GT2 family glycosyltransferase
MNTDKNAQEFCFIICSNDELYTKECVFYIEHLRIPVDWQIDVKIIKDAKSMTAGYNQGMQASNAKYKVYLHQDVFIVNRDFIKDCLEIFRQDEQIGMIGMVGSPRLPVSGIMWKEERCGELYAWRVSNTVRSVMADEGPAQVEAIDGFLMVTQYDLPWREDLFDKWDFYDCSQSMEFTRAGYKIMIPEMKSPWCLHDGLLIAKEHYEGEREKFLREYQKEMLVYQERSGYRATLILTSYSERTVLQDTLEWLGGVEGISNIIVVDNGSQDGTAEWLASQGYEYVWFDEGTQGYGKLWNTVLQNFETEEYVIFMEAGVYPEKDSAVRLMESLNRGNAVMASPFSNSYPYANDTISDPDDLAAVRKCFEDLPRGRKYGRTLYTNWKMWAVRRELVEKNGYFREELYMPENVLLDYSLRMMCRDLVQTVCHTACAYDTFRICKEKYRQAVTWKEEDKAVLKSIWDMNYLNIRPNATMAGFIQEEEQKEFKVLEVGCDLGATLLEIRNKYPRCRTFGVDINRAAINIASHIAEVQYCDIEKLCLPFDEKFDYIIFGDVLEHLRNPEEVLRMCHTVLTEDGCIMASIPNIMHISVLEELIHGRFIYTDQGLLDRTHIHFFTYYEIMDMFQRAGYVVESVKNMVLPISEKQQEMKTVLDGLSKDTEDWMFDTFQYRIKARRQHKS